MKLRYFAAVRDRIGVPEEEVALPAEVQTVGDLVGWLRARGPEYALALQELSAVRFAVDQLHARVDRRLGDAREVAVFPPMTGG